MTTANNVKTASIRTPMKGKTEEEVKPAKLGNKLGRESEIGGIWVKESKKGDEYMTGDVLINGEKTSIIIFRNGYKEQPNQPDFRIYKRAPLDTETL